MDELLVNKAILDECLEQLRPTPPPLLTGCSGFACFKTSTLLYRSIC